MKKILATTTAIFVVIFSYSQYNCVTVNSQQVRKDMKPIASDNYGNTIITGTFATTITLGSFTLNNNNGYDQIFVAKKFPDGTFAWVKKLEPVAISGGTSYSNIYGVSTDAAGNVYITGNFYGKIKFANNITLTSTMNGTAYTGDIFTGKILSNGKVDWVKSAGTGNDGCNAGEYGRSVITDNAGNVYTTGQIVSMVFTNTTVCNDVCPGATRKSVTCPYVVKYSASGSKLWERLYPNNGALASTSCWYNHPQGTNIRTDGTNIYVSGYFYGTVNFGDGPLNTGSETVSNCFLIKLNAAGTTLWSRSVTGNANYAYGVGDGLFVDGSDVYISGIGENISFGTCSLPLGGGPPTFLAKYSSSGSCQWAIKPQGICYGAVNHPNGNLASLVRRGASVPMRYDIKEFSRLDGSAVDSTCFLEADTATGSVTGYPSIAQTTDGFVFSQMVTGTFHFGNLTVTASVPKGGGWPDMMLIKYKGTPPPAARPENMIPEPAVSKIVLYPNPATHQLAILNRSNKLLGHLKIYDVTGKIVYQKFWSSSQTVIDVKNLAAGVYYIKSDQARITLKFVKQ